MEELGGAVSDPLKQDEEVVLQQHGDREVIGKELPVWHSAPVHFRIKSDPVTTEHSKITESGGARSQFDRRRIFSNTKQESFEIPEDFKNYQPEDNVFSEHQRSSRKLPFQRSMSMPSVLPDVIPGADAISSLLPPDAMSSSSQSLSPDVVSNTTDIKEDDKIIFERTNDHSSQHSHQNHHVESLNSQNLTSDNTQETKNNFEGSVHCDPFPVQKRKKSVTFDKTVPDSLVLRRSQFRKSSGYGSQSDGSQGSCASNTQSQGSSVLSDDVLEEKKSFDLEEFTSTGVDGDKDDVEAQRKNVQRKQDSDCVQDTQEARQRSDSDAESYESWQRENSPKVNFMPGKRDNINTFAREIGTGSVQCNVVTGDDFSVGHQYDLEGGTAGLGNKNDPLQCSFPVESNNSATAKEPESEASPLTKISPTTKEEYEFGLMQQQFLELMLKFDETKDSISDLLDSDWAKNYSLLTSPKSPFQIPQAVADALRLRGVRTTCGQYLQLPRVAGPVSAQSQGRTVDHRQDPHNAINMHNLHKQASDCPVARHPIPSHSTPYIAEQLIATLQHINSQVRPAAPSASSATQPARQGATNYPILPPQNIHNTPGQTNTSNLEWPHPGGCRRQITPSYPPGPYPGRQQELTGVPGPGHNRISPMPCQFPPSSNRAGMTGVQVQSGNQPAAMANFPLCGGQPLDLRQRFLQQQQPYTPASNLIVTGNQAATGAVPYTCLQSSQAVIASIHGASQQLDTHSTHHSRLACSPNIQSSTVGCFPNPDQSCLRYPTSGQGQDQPTTCMRLPAELFRIFQESEQQKQSQNGIRAPHQSVFYQRPAVYPPERTQIVPDVHLNQSSPSEEERGEARSSGPMGRGLPRQTVTQAQRERNEVPSQLAVAFPESTSYRLPVFDDSLEISDLSTRVEDNDLERVVNFSQCSFSRCSNSECFQFKEMLKSLKEVMKRGTSDLNNNHLNMLRVLQEHYLICDAPSCQVPWCRYMAYRIQEETEQMQVTLMTLLSSPLHTLLPDGFLVDRFFKLDSTASWKEMPKEWEDWLMLCPLSNTYSIAKATPLFRIHPFSHWVVKMTPLHEGENQLDVLRKVCSLQNSHIVPHLWAAISPSDLLVVCTEYFCGMSVRDILDQKGSLSVEASQHYLGQILDALQYLHQRTIVYLNWTCSNILVDGMCTQVKLHNLLNSVDLSTKTADIGAVKMSLPADVVPFELLKGDELCEKSDSWGLACVVHEMMIGKRPWFDLRHNRQEQIWSRIVETTPPELSEGLHNCPRLFIQNCLQKDPKLRPSVDDVMERMHTSWQQ